MNSNRGQRQKEATNTSHDMHTGKTFSVKSGDAISSLLCSPEWFILCKVSLFFPKKEKEIALSHKIRLL